MAFPLAAIAGIGAKGLGGVQGNQITEQGAKDALTSQRKGTAFEKELLEMSIARQQPFIDAGQAALPLSELAASGGAKFRDTPIFRTRENIGLDELVKSIQGDELSGFARDRFDTTLAGSEQEQNKARLSDLINIALGASGQAGQAGAQLAGSASNAALRSGDIRSTGAQTSFENRQNIVNEQLGGISALPAFFAATNQPGSVSPFITQNNPRGLTPGQGL